jgi:hypothetical protein
MHTHIGSLGGTLPVDHWVAAVTLPVELHATICTASWLALACSSSSTTLQCRVVQTGGLQPVLQVGWQQAAATSCCLTTTQAMRCFNLVCSDLLHRFTCCCDAICKHCCCCIIVLHHCPQGSVPVGTYHLVWRPCSWCSHRPGHHRWQVSSSCCAVLHYISVTAHFPASPLLSHRSVFTTASSAFSR